MITIYYTLDYSPTIYEFRDDYNWDLSDDMELESLFEMLAYDSYQQNSLLWADKHTKTIIIRTKEGEPIRAMYADIYFEPAFSVYGREPDAPF
jgi:hypothetical protein